MELDTSGPYSPDKVYGQLTYPFQPPKVTINSHTPYDEPEDDAAVSWNDFKGKTQSFKYEKSEDGAETKAAKAYGLETGFKPNHVEYGFETPEFPPKNVRNFSASQISSDAIVKKAIGNGYSFKEAMAIRDTQKAYGLAKDPIGRLGDGNFKVNQG